MNVEKKLGLQFLAAEKQRMTSDGSGVIARNTGVYFLLSAQDDVDFLEIKASSVNSQPRMTLTLSKL